MDVVALNAHAFKIKIANNATKVIGSKENV